MAENTTAKATEVKTTEPVKAADVKTDEPKQPTEAELKAMFDALPEMFRDTITKLNAEIDQHNEKVASVQSAEQKNPTLIKAEIYEQNTKNNKKLAALRKQELELIRQQEELRKQAYEVIDTDGLMPKELTEEAIETLKGEITTGVKGLRDQVSALSTFEEMMPTLKGKVLPLIHDIKTRQGRGAKAGTTKSGDGPKRIRFKKIEVNGLTADANGNTVYGVVNNEEKYTFSLASAFLRKQHKGISWTANDLTEAYLKGQDENALPDEREFVMPYTYKDTNGNEQTVNFTIKCFR